MSPETRSSSLPAADALVYLNTGSAGPLLRSVEVAMNAALTHETEHGRADGASWEAFLASRQAVRDELGSLVRADASEIVLTHHTTEGLNIALWGLDWQPGDHIALTSLEHDAGIAAVHTVARRFDLVVDVVECGMGATDDVLAGLRIALEARPRLVVASHVAWSTGAVLPIAEISRLAHDAGAAVLVDGAQAVGAVDVDVTALDADFYSFNGYKWLCGPEGSGALVVRSRWFDRLLPSFGGAFGVDGSTVHVGDVAGMAPAPGAARYESGSWYRPSLIGLVAAVRWFIDLRAEGRAAEWVTRQASLCARRLEDELGATVHTPRNAEVSGLVAFSIDGLVARDAVQQLERDGVVIRAVPGSGHFRASCATFTTDEDIDALVRSLRALTA